MLAELDVAVYVKSDDDLAQSAQRVFGALGSSYEAGSEDEVGAPNYRTSGFGFNAVFYENAGNMEDPEFEDFEYTIEITSRYWCAEADGETLEAALSDYYGRLLAFELNAETATDFLVDTTEEAEVFEIRRYRRNPQYRLDQAPTTPKTFIIETRQVEDPFEEEESEDEDFDAEDDEGS